MQFDNLFGYEEQQQQQQIQPQQVEAVNGYINQLISSQIKSSNSKRGKKQNPKLNQFKQIVFLNPKSKAKIQKKNQKKGQVQNNHLDRVYPFDQEMLFKIQENSEELKGVLSKIDNIIKKQQQEFDENKLFFSKGFHTMQNCFIGCLMQFQQLRLYFPDLVINYQTPQSNLNLKQGQDYVNLDKILKRNQAQLPEIKFSETYKNESIKLDKFRISAQSKLSGYSICELPLSKQAIQKFAFKINKLNGNIAIGVCNKDILAQQNYQPNNPINTQDLYLLQNNGEVYPNQEKEMQQGQPFEFQQSNYIMLIVNFQKQYIKWIKNNHNQEFSMNFNIKDDVYPCVLFSYYQTAVNKLQQITIMKPKTLGILDGYTIFEDE